MPPSPRRMEMPAQMEDLHKARRFVREFCKSDVCRQLTREDLWQLELAVHEVTANIIRHAYKDRTDQRILVEIQVLKDRLMVNFNHWGTPFVQKSVPLPILDGTAKNGFGLYLIERCVDSVFYECTPTGKNIITLLKRRTRETSKKKPGIDFSNKKERIT